MISFIIIDSTKKKSWYFYTSSSGANGFDCHDKLTIRSLSVIFLYLRESESKEDFFLLNFLTTDCLSAVNTVYFVKGNSVDRFFYSENLEMRWSSLQILMWKGPNKLIFFSRIYVLKPSKILKI